MSLESRAQCGLGGQACKLAAVRAQYLTDYPCDPNWYDPTKGGSQPAELREERLARDILRLGDGDDIEVPTSRTELDSDGHDWLQEIERHSAVIAEQPEPEKLRVATQWATES